MLWSTWRYLSTAADSRLSEWLDNQRALCPLPTSAGAAQVTCLTRPCVTRPPPSRPTWERSPRTVACTWGFVSGRLLRPTADHNATPKAGRHVAGCRVPLGGLAEQLRRGGDHLTVGRHQALPAHVSGWWGLWSPSPSWCGPINLSSEVALEALHPTSCFVSARRS